MRYTLKMEIETKTQYHVLISLLDAMSLDYINTDTTIIVSFDTSGDLLKFSQMLSSVFSGM